jgi:hypothetical protein
MEVGSRVLCTDSSIKASEIFMVSMVYSMWVDKGSEYTVREVLDNDGIVTGLLLDGVVNDPIPQELLGGRFQEPAFRVTRFQELHEDMAEVNQEAEVWMN